MSAAVPQADRRNSIRLIPANLPVRLRLRGRLLSRVGHVLDCSREGIGIHLPSPIPMETRVYLYVHMDSIHIEHLVGVVHNCSPRDGGYRIGIQYRLNAPDQLDVEETQRALGELLKKLDT